MLNTNQKNLLKHVIAAAQEGNYCHGNGADWVITNQAGDTVICINHVRESYETLDATASANYLANTPRHSEPHTAESLIAFIA